MKNMSLKATESPQSSQSTVFIVRRDTECAEAIREQFPGCPAEEAAAIANHACQKHSGRVGRSAAAKQFDSTAARLAVIARIRHMHTRYDEILMRTNDRTNARSEVRNDVDRILEKWSVLPQS